MKMTSFEFLKNLDTMSALTSYVCFINEILFTVSKENATVLYFFNGSPQGRRGGKLSRTWARGWERGSFSPCSINLSLNPSPP